jgi:hypothetical protein
MHNLKNRVTYHYIYYVWLILQIIIVRLGIIFKAILGTIEISSYDTYPAFITIQLATSGNIHNMHLSIQTQFHNNDILPIPLP